MSQIVHVATPRCTCRLFYLLDATYLVKKRSVVQTERAIARQFERMHGKSIHTHIWRIVELINRAVFAPVDKIRSRRCENGHVGLEQVEKILGDRDRVRLVEIVHTNQVEIQLRGRRLHHYGHEWIKSGGVCGQAVIIGETVSQYEQIILFKWDTKKKYD